MVPLSRSTRPMLAALRRGELVALIADRDLTGDGVPVTMFGHPTTLPAGPATLALRTERPLLMARVLRTGPERFSVRAELVEAPRTGQADQDVAALTTALAAAVRSRHRRGARAVVGGVSALLDRSAPRRARRRGSRVTPRSGGTRGKADMHLHTPLLGRHRGGRGVARSTSRRRPTWTWWRSPITSAWMARCAPARSTPPATSTSTWWSARRSPRGAATCWPSSSRSASPPCGRCPRRWSASTTRAAWRSRRIRWRR